MMNVDNTKDRVFVTDLDEELAEENSEGQELYFLQISKNA